MTRYLPNGVQMKIKFNKLKKLHYQKLIISVSAYYQIITDYIFIGQLYFYFSYNHFHKRFAFRKKNIYLYISIL